MTPCMGELSQIDLELIFGPLALNVLLGHNLISLSALCAFLEYKLGKVVDIGSHLCLVFGHAWRPIEPLAPWNTIQFIVVHCTTKISL